MTFEQTITDMGILSSEVYDDKNQGYFEFNADGQRKNSTITTANGTYTIIDSADTINSMQALLLKAPDGKFVIAFRGTQEPLDGFYDITTGLLNYNPQIGDATKFVNKMMLDYNIKSSDLTLTGHSLGGILTQAVGATLNIQGVTFNAWSSSNLIDYSNYLLDPLGLIHRLASLLGWASDETAFAERNILNLSYVDSGMFNGDPLSNALSGFLGLNEHLGATFPIFGTDLNVLDGHRMPNMIEALNHYNDLLSHFENKDFLVLTMAYMLSDLSGSNNFYEKGESYFNEIGVYDAAADSLSFNFLNDFTAFEIADRANNDRAVLFAVLKLNGFAVEGNLTAYADIDLAHYSETYVAQRSLFLYSLLDPNNAKLADTHFSDRDMGISQRSASNDNLNHILFGSESISSTNGDYLIGGTKADFLFGMNGDDILISDAGNDYLEGGEGSDILIGGKDYDTYVVDNGDQVYDSDGVGEIIFNNYILEGGQIIAGTDNQYEGRNGEYYVLEGSILSVYDNYGNSVIINSFNKDNNDLGITLEDNKKEINIYVGDATALEGGVLEFTVGIDNTLEEDLVLNVESYFDDTLGASAEDITMPTVKTITIKAGETSATYRVATNDDSEVEDTEKFTFAVTSIEPYTGNDMNTHLIVNAGEGTIDDNDDEQVLHVNITSVDTQEGDLDDNNQLTFIIGTSRVLKDGESVTLNLNINDITTDSSDYGFLSQDTITLNSSNQYQTITLDIFGDEEKEASETLSLNATVVESTGVSDVKIISDTATIYDDDAGATPYDDILILTDEADMMDALAGDDYVDGKGGNDYIDGNSGNDLIFGGDGSDVLFGGSGDDVIVAGDGDDVLSGDEGVDYLVGGTGFDYYLAGDGDTILDSDGNGVVLFNNTDLSGVKKKLKDSDVYEDENYTYTQRGGLVVTSKDTGESLTIVDWSNENFTCIEFKTANNISTCNLHVERIKRQREVA